VNKTATVEKIDWDGIVFKVDPPLTTQSEYVLASQSSEETYFFPSTKDGAVLSLAELYPPSGNEGECPLAALRDEGYEIVDPKGLVRL
jgi:hypothetical protein